MKEDFKAFGAIAAKTDTTVDLDPVLGAPDPREKDTDYFASGGWLEGGTGLTFESRTIKHSETVAGKLRLTFSRALLHQDVGAQLRFWPGCNRAMETCMNVFDNRPNFRGHNCSPVKNPSANLGTVQQSAGREKGVARMENRESRIVEATALMECGTCGYLQTFSSKLVHDGRAVGKCDNCGAHRHWKTPSSGTRTWTPILKHQ